MWWCTSMHIMNNSPSPQTMRTHSNSLKKKQVLAFNSEYIYEVYQNAIQIISLWMQTHSQMGSHMKKSIFDEQTSRALLNWQKAAKKHAGRAGGSTTTTMHGGRTEESASRSLEGASPIPIAPVASASMSNIHSSPATLHRFKTTGHSSYDEYKMSVLEVDHLAESATARLIVRVDNGDIDVETSALQPSEELQEVDFTFGTLAPQHES